MNKFNMVFISFLLVILIFAVVAFIAFNPQAKLDSNMKITDKAFRLKILAENPSIIFVDVVRFYDFVEVDEAIFLSNCRRVGVIQTWKQYGMFTEQVYYKFYVDGTWLAYHIVVSL